jgi:hypothetical protein
MSENGSNTDTAPNSEHSGAVTSKETARRNPSQGKFKSGIQNKRSIKIDVNKHGIRRETNMQPAKKVGRKKV